MDISSVIIVCEPPASGKSVLSKDDSKLNLNTVKIGAIAVVGVLAIITIGVLAPELLPAF